MNLEFSRQFIEKYSNINFMKIPPVEAELFHAEGQMDGHEETNRRFSLFCERA